MPEEIAIAALGLGDIVRGSGNEFSDGVVVKIEDMYVTIFRPYVITSDFSYSAGHGGSQVIPYTGWETYSIWKSSTAPITRLRKAEEKR